MPRLFTAIELPDRLRETLAALRQPLPGAKWLDADDLHITIRFAGDVDNRTAREFSDLLGNIEAIAFELTLSGLGAFGGNDPRVIWAGVAGSRELDALARANERVARAAGLAAEPRNFKPHVAIARLRGTPVELVARFLERHAAFRSAPFVVPRFVLFSSKPKVGGGPYVVEAAYPLGGAIFQELELD